MLPPHDEWVSGNSAGPYTSPLDKFLIHMTEGGSIEGAVSAYRTNNSWPHLTVECRFGKRYRRCGHLDMNTAARSLKNMSGGVETNTDGVIQVEVVGYSAQPELVDWEWFALNVIEPICQPLMIPCQSPVDWVAYPDSYGKTAAQRLSPDEWTLYKGILGHQHAPENDHGDPGAIPIDLILAALPTGDDMALTAADKADINKMIRDALLDFQRLPVIWAGHSRPTHWYWWSHAAKVLVDSNQARSLVDNGMAEWSGTRAGDPDGIGQAAIVPDDILNLAPTIGPDDYPPSP